VSNATEFSVAVLRDGTVAVAGDVDAASAEELSKTLQQGLDASRDLLVDMGGVTFVDSEGIRCLLRAAATAHARGGIVRIRSAPNVMTRILDVLGLWAAPGLIVDRCEEGRPPAGS
jgi:anti-anti-sigma factor